MNITRTYKISFDSICRREYFLTKTIDARDFQNKILKSYDVICVENPLIVLELWIEDDVLDLFDLYLVAHENQDNPEWCVHATFEHFYFRAELASGETSVKVTVCIQGGDEIGYSWVMDQNEYVEFWGKFIGLLESLCSPS